MTKITLQTPMNPVVERITHVLDAKGQILGRLAVKAAKLLRGKDKSTFTKHVEMGDFVEIYNIDKIKVTGTKLQNKLYYRHSGYLGSMKVESLAAVLNRKPDFVIRKAIERMLPDNRLRKVWLSRLKTSINDLPADKKETNG